MDAESWFISLCKRNQNVQHDLSVGGHQFDAKLSKEFLLDAGMGVYDSSNKCAGFESRPA